MTLDAIRKSAHFSNRRYTIDTIPVIYFFQPAKQTKIRENLFHLISRHYSDLHARPDLLSDFFLHPGDVGK